jgi:hypothetical protein
MSECVGEISDIGLYVSDNSYGRFSNNRCDLNYGHGYVISTGANQFLNCTAMRNSAEATNTYSGFVVSGVHNIFCGCYAASLDADGFYHKYGFYDTTSQGGINDHNIYFACKSLLHATSWFYNSEADGPCASVRPGQAWYYAEGATPSVENMDFIRLNYSVTTTITNFTNGISGQCVSVIVDNANVTIQNNSNIKTNSAEDVPLQKDKIYSFRNYNGVWREISSSHYGSDTTAAGAGTDGTISSRNANALGECDGFLKMYKTDGTLVFVPYWEDITP